MTQVKKISKQVKKDQLVGSQRDLLEQLFDDHYTYRWRVYQINFFRGIFFGIGTFIGATVVVGVSLWVLSLFTELPLVGNLFEKTQTTIENKAN